MTLTEQLLTVTTAYGAANKLSPARLSTVLFNDGKRLKSIAAGGDLGTKNFEKAMKWLSANWPADTAWPENIARPTVTPEPELAAAN